MTTQKSIRKLVHVLCFFVLTALYSTQAYGLTTAEFFKICKGHGATKCSDVPILQAYIGGSLDLLATLVDHSDYMEQLYCVEPEKLYSVELIMAYMEKERASYESANAMNLVIKYFEENGGCDDKNT